MNKSIFKWILMFLSVILLVVVIILQLGVIKIYREFQPFEIIADMDNQIKTLPQKESSFFPDSSSFRNPIDNTIPKYGSKYHLTDLEYEEAEVQNNNPLEPTEKVIARGKNRFETFCVPCHNHDGKGKGVIITNVKLKEGEEGFPAPANLTRDFTRSISDARIFHILSAGQNLMFPVNYKLNETDRWALVHYIRKLQKDSIR
jgi:hypothetical protein